MARSTPLVIDGQTDMASDYQIPVTQLNRLSDTRYSAKNYQIPITQLNRDMQVVTQREMEICKKGTKGKWRYASRKRD